MDHAHAPHCHRIGRPDGAASFSASSPAVAARRSGSHRQSTKNAHSRHRARGGPWPGPVEQCAGPHPVDSATHNRGPEGPHREVGPSAQEGFLAQAPRATCCGRSRASCRCRSPQCTLGRLRYLPSDRRTAIARSHSLTFHGLDYTLLLPRSYHHLSSSMSLDSCSFDMAASSLSASSSTSRFVASIRR
jgi:hypothetical protein